MSDIYIVTAKNFEQFKQRARKLKQSEKIPHHEALERVAKSLNFENWHQVTVAAAETEAAENAHRSGLIIALDVKDASEYDFERDGAFVEDLRLWRFCEAELFDDYRLSKDDDGRTFESTNTKEELLEDFQNYSTNVILYRYTRNDFPSSVEDAFDMSRERCFFAPLYVWLKGRFISVFDYSSLINSSFPEPILDTSSKSAIKRSRWETCRSMM